MFLMAVGEDHISLIGVCFSRELWKSCPARTTMLSNWRVFVMAGVKGVMDEESMF